MPKPTPHFAHGVNVPMGLMAGNSTALHTGLLLKGGPISTFAIRMSHMHLNNAYAPISHSHIWTLSKLPLTNLTCCHSPFAELPFFKIRSLHPPTPHFLFCLFLWHAQTRFPPHSCNSRFRRWRKNAHPDAHLASVLHGPISDVCVVCSVHATSAVVPMCTIG